MTILDFILSWDRVSRSPDWLPTCSVAKDDPLILYLTGAWIAAVYHHTWLIGILMFGCPDFPCELCRAKHELST